MENVECVDYGGSQNIRILLLWYAEQEFFQLDQIFFKLCQMLKK